MTDKLVCMHCGYNKFKKQGVMSCSAVPPLFKCADCDKYTRVPVTYMGNLLVEEGFINYKQEWYLHIECSNCGRPPKDGEEFIVVPYEEYDPDGNPMFRRTIMCPECH